MVNRVKEKIIKLRKSGKSYGEIAKLLNCSKGTIAYHCGDGQKAKAYNRRKINSVKLINKIRKKIQNFSLKRKTYIYPISTSELRLKILYRIVSFSMREDRTTYTTPLFTVDEFLEKIGESPRCYLSGKLLNIEDHKSWSIDHKIPRSKGGDNTLDNADICDSTVNSAKTDMLIDDFLNVCKSVLEHNGYTVVKK